MRLTWSAAATADRVTIFNYIEAENPRAAANVDERIGAQVKILKKFPEAGRIGRVEGTRELVIHRTPYLAAYQVKGNTVRILRVLHGAQLWPGEIQG